MIKWKESDNKNGGILNRIKGGLNEIENIDNEEQTNQINTSQVNPPNKPK